MPPGLDRYHRQILLACIGEQGQRRLGEAHALLVGCGALGSMIVDLLVRAGVGEITIVDRDTVELTNLQRQVLFDESDVERVMPKAEAARARLSRINAQVTVNARVEDLNHRNAARYVQSADLVIDGLDNFETRYLLNDAAVRFGRPYVYGGAVATGGMTMAILPHPERRLAAAAPGRVTWSAEQSTPCLRGVFPDAPPPGAVATCDTAGVLGSAVAVIAAHQVSQAIKLLVGDLDALDRSLLSVDVWENRQRSFDVSGARVDCPCCVNGRFEYLEGAAGSAVTSLCGRNAVQITPPGGAREGGRLDLAVAAARLAPHGDFSFNGYLVHGRFARERVAADGPVELTLFPDGRAIIKGTNEPETARSIYARYVGT